jgi:hypothetical protein
VKSSEYPQLTNLESVSPDVSPVLLFLIVRGSPILYSVLIIQASAGTTIRKSKKIPLEVPRGSPYTNSMKNKEKQLLVVKHLVRVPKKIDVSYSDNTRKKLDNIEFYVNVYFKKGTINGVRIDLPCGWLTNTNDPIISELVEYIRPFNPLYKDIKLKDVLID